MVNGTHPTLRGDPYSPGLVLRALNNSGWVISPDEHDAHELFYAILSSVETEATKPKKVGCLSDALGELGVTGMRNEMPPRPSSALLSDFCNSEYDESTMYEKINDHVKTEDNLFICI